MHFFFQIFSLIFKIFRRLHRSPLERCKRFGNKKRRTEAGSQRMRDVINKGLTEEIILKGAREAFEGGWKRVKLYFMLGLPEEEDRSPLAKMPSNSEVTASWH